MSERPELAATLRRRLLRSSRLAARRLWGAAGDFGLDRMGAASGLEGEADAVARRSVLVRVHDPVAAAAALVALDGVARRIVLCPPDLAEADLPSVIRDAEADAVASDTPELAVPGLRFAPIRAGGGQPQGGGEREVATEWALFTSGTSGAPKLAVHSLEGLCGAIRPATEEAPIWGTFYDIRRFGGLQILLRTLVREGSMVLGHPEEPFPGFLQRLARCGATHLTGTPSHWRRALMTPAASALNPRYLRLSGEIADQAVLDALAARFPGVPIGHAYASTEAGVCFEVVDGQEGFPAGIVSEDSSTPVAMRIVDDGLQVRSVRTALRYLGEARGPLRDSEGWVDTGDIVERRGDRFHFRGRRSGVINIGGLKAHPETIEAVLNRHPAVRLSRASGRKSPITGAIVAAEVVPADGAAADGRLRDDILVWCRSLPAHMRPASIRFVDALPMSANGKLERTIA